MDALSVHQRYRTRWISCYIGSTSGIVAYCRDADEAEFLVAAEVGLMHMLKKEAPDKTFYLVSNTTVCTLMKMPTLMKVEEELEKEKQRIVVIPEEIVAEARRPIERMLELSL